MLHGRIANLYGQFLMEASCAAALEQISQQVEDTTDGHHRCFLGGILGDRYQIAGELGAGAFGNVVEAIDKHTQRRVAVKIAASIPAHRVQALSEIEMMHLIGADPNIVEILAAFEFHNHVCIVLEKLWINLYTLLEDTKFWGLNADAIRSVTEGVLLCLARLKEQSVIHADLKPENILLVGPDSFRVKVIDFGSSFVAKDDSLVCEVQTRFYRAPEVFMHKPVSTAIDMWSLGCILAELHTGTPLFPGQDDASQLDLIMDMMGPSSADMPATSSSQQVARDSDVQERRPPTPFSLQQFLGEDVDADMLDFITQCLAIDPRKRLDPQQGLRHAFICNRQDDDLSSLLGQVALTTSRTDSELGEEMDEVGDEDEEAYKTRATPACRTCWV